MNDEDMNLPPHTNDILLWPNLHIIGLQLGVFYSLFLAWAQRQWPVLDGDAVIFTVIVGVLLVIVPMHIIKLPNNLTVRQYQSLEFFQFMAVGLPIAIWQLMEWLWLS